MRLIGIAALLLLIGVLLWYSNWSTGRVEAPNQNELIAEEITHSPRPIDDSGVGGPREAETVSTDDEDVAIVGRVYVADTDEGIPGVLLVASLWDSFSATTGENGEFRFDGLYPGNWTVATDSRTGSSPLTRGFASRTVSIPETGITKRVDIGMKIGAYITGTVTDSNAKPLSHVTVALMGEGLERPEMNRMATNASGQFRFMSHATDRPLSVWAIKDGYAVHQSEDFRVRAFGEERVDIVLQAGASISGTIVDQHGAPVADAHVTVFNESGDVVPYDTSFGSKPLAKTTPGRFSISNLPAGTFSLSAKIQMPFTTVMRSGRSTVRSIYASLPDRHDASAAPHAVVTVAEGEQKRGVQLRLKIFKPDETLLRTINGTVRNEAGDAIPNATIVNGAGTREQTTTTDGEGRYAFRLLKTDRIIVQASTPGKWPEREVIPPGESRTLDLVLRSIPVITGRVVDAVTGEAISEFLVQTDDYPDDEIVWQANNAIRVSDATGRFSIKETGRYPTSVDVFATGYTPGTHLLATEAGASAEIEIALTKGPLVVGRVLDPAGNPLSDAVVRAMSSLKNPHRFPRPTNPLVALTDADGNFSLSTLTLGITSLEVSHPDYAPAIVPVELTDGVTTERIVQLTEGAIFHGAVYWDDKPFAGQKIILSGTSKIARAQKHAVTDTDGQFRFSGLFPGKWRAQIEFENHGGGSEFEFCEVEEQKEFGVAGEEIIEHDFHYAHWDTEVIGQIEGFDSAPEHVIVRFDFHNEWGQPKFEANANVYDDGSFRIEKIPPGRYSVEVSVRGDGIVSRNARKRIQVIDGQTTELVIPIKTGLSVTAIVNCPDNISAFNLKVYPGQATAEQVQDKKGPFTHHSSGSGRVGFEVPKPGLYTVVAIPRYLDLAIPADPVYEYIDVHPDQPNEVALDF
jgi:hypothetical protein